MFPQRANPAAVKRAQPCPPESRATRTYTAREIAGCWLFTGPGGKKLGPPLYDGPVHLTRRVTPRLRESPFYDPGDYAVESRSDTLTFGYPDAWRVVPPDTVEIAQSTGFTGNVVTLRARGDSLLGIIQGFNDVIVESYDTTDDPVTAVQGRRVACPPPNSVTPRR